MFSKPRVLFLLLSCSVLLGLLLSNIGTVAAGAGQVKPLPLTGTHGRAATPPCKTPNESVSTNFSNPTRIDNQWYPLQPGTQFILDGTINAGNVPTAHRVVFTITDLTKVIDGVTTRVVWDTDTNAGKLAESELAFQAQDNNGNVWVLGEYPEEYKAGVFTGAPFTWISGLERAEGGILVPGHPQVGTLPFIEGVSPKIDFWDCGQVAAIGKSLSIHHKRYHNVLVINEWTPPEPNGGTQQKYYAPGVGIVQIGDVNDPEAETMTLTKVVHLDPSGLAQARAEALKLDRHGYRVSAIYRKTSPAK